MAFPTHGGGTPWQKPTAGDSWLPLASSASNVYNFASPSWVASATRPAASSAPLVQAFESVASPPARTSSRLLTAIAAPAQAPPVAAPVTAPPSGSSLKPPMPPVREPRPDQDYIAYLEDWLDQLQKSKAWLEQTP